MSTAEKRGQKRPPPGELEPFAVVKSAEDEDDICWLCLDAHHESGQQLRRDCSCRGGSGFAHLACIVEYAKQKTQQWDDEDEPDFHLFEPWAECPNCKHRYQHQLAVDVAAEFTTFVNKTYPDEKRMHLEALMQQLATIRRSQPNQKDEAKQIANKILSMIGQMKTEDPSIPERTLILEPVVYLHLGHISLSEETQEDAKLAMEYFEKSLDICNSKGFTGGVTSAGIGLAKAKVRYEGATAQNEKELLEKQRTAYKYRIEALGQDALITLHLGVDVAVTLKQANNGIEAERLLTKLATISNRVHGPDHVLTKKADSHLQQCKVRCVNIESKDGEQCFQALRYEDDGGKCVLRGPIADPRNVQEEEMFTVTSQSVRPTLGTPVVCHGLKDSLTRLNGKIGDVRSVDEGGGRCKVHFADTGLRPCFVKQENIRILFDLPDE